jgi:hypothetical protein
MNFNSRKSTAIWEERDGVEKGEVCKTRCSVFEWMQFCRFDKIRDFFL